MKVNSFFVSCSAAIVAISTAILSSACSQNSEQLSQVKIAGGKTVDSNTPEFVSKSVVAFAQNADFYNPLTGHRSSFCTGVVLNEKYILTAAHCSDMRAQTLVVFGNSMTEARKTAASSTRQVVKVTKHPGYPDTFVQENGLTLRRNEYEDAPGKWMEKNPGIAPHDIAVIEFSGGLPEGYKPVNIAEANEPLPTVATQAGFGITKTSNIGDTGVLRWLEENVLHTPTADDTSRNWLEVGFTADAGEIAKGLQIAQGACPGDSGGPAFVKVQNNTVVAGILSLGESERITPDANFAFCGAHKPGTEKLKFNVYTDVRAYKTWIAENTKL